MPTVVVEPLLDVGLLELVLVLILFEVDLVELVLVPVLLEVDLVELELVLELVLLELVLELELLEEEPLELVLELELLEEELLELVLELELLELLELELVGSVVVVVPVGSVVPVFVVVNSLGTSPPPDHANVVPMTRLAASTIVTTAAAIWRNVFMFKCFTPSLQSLLRTPVQLHRHPKQRLMGVRHRPRLNEADGFA